MSQSLAIVLLLVFSESVAWGYRPFIATDAAVADPKEMEFFPLSRSKVKYSAGSSSRTDLVEVLRCFSSPSWSPKRLEPRTSDARELAAHPNR
jgi:hypothetical protein